MKKFSLKVKFLCIAGLVLGLAACGPSPTGTPSFDGNYTAAAETIAVQMTLEAGETAVAQLTEIAERPTLSPVTAGPLTPAPVTLIPATVMVDTPQPPSPTSVPPSITPTPSPTPWPCDWAEFIVDVNPLPDRIFAPGESFLKTWRISNLGTCTWTEDYSLVFVGGDAVYSLPVEFPAPVQPFQMVDVSVELTAPLRPGLYRGDWLLRNANGALFGVGPQASDPLFAEFQVEDLDLGGELIYNFAASYCAADWISGEGRLDCPGDRGDADGSAVLLDEPDLETREQNEQGLWTRPNEHPNGWISGYYPPFQVLRGDTFLAEVGCMDRRRDCDVLFMLDYLDEDGDRHSLGLWEEVYDRQTTPIQVNLSELDGETVEFILTVNNVGDPEDADAVWLRPRIEAPGAEGNLVLFWRQEDGLEDECYLMRIYLFGAGRADAVVHTCDRNRQVGSIRLSDDYYDTLVDWYNELAPFKGEVYRATGAMGLESDFELVSRGDEDANDEEIRAIDAFASDLLDAILP